jgi:long-chain acyl-CoA synthetase
MVSLFSNSGSKIITEDGNTYFYSELVEICNKINSLIDASALVLCQVDNTLGGLLGYFSFAYGLHVPLILGTEVHESHLDEIIRKYQPEFSWIPDKVLKQRYTDRPVIFSKYGYHLIKMRDDKYIPLFSELCLLASTSGSTGSPKFVRQSRNNIYSNTESIVKYLEIDHNDLAITSLPITYTYGMSIVNCQIFSGGDILLTNKSIVQKEFWEQLRGNPVSLLAGVPYTFEMMDRLRVFRKDLPGLNKILQAGGKLNELLQEKVAKYCQDNNKKFFVMYGQTEATTRMSYIPPYICLDKIGSIGIPIPGGEFSLIDNDGNTIDKPEVCGELIYKGKNVCLGYAESRDDLHLPGQWNGRLKTGDLACFDKDNFFYIKGRLKRIVKHFGLRINLDEVENLLRTKYMEKKFACVDSGDFLFIYSDSEINKDDLLKYISEVTEIKRAGVKILHIDSFPLLTNGKIDYQELRALAQLPIVSHKPISFQEN